MSEAQLQQILAENEKLKREADLTADIIKVSEACAKYVFALFIYGSFYLLLTQN